MNKRSGVVSEVEPVSLGELRATDGAALVVKVCTPP